MKTKALLFFILSFVFSVINCYAQGTWTLKQNYGGGATSRAVSACIGNKGYVGTGEGSQGFWEYNPLTNLWTQKADFGGGSRDWGIGFSIGTKVYIGMGANGPEMNDLWEWDQLNNVWTQKASLGTSDSMGIAALGRVGAVAFSIGGKGYVGTGINQGYALSDFWEYDPVLDSWTQKANFGGGIRYGAVCFTIGNKAYVGTGADALGGFYKDFWSYDPLTDIWTQIPDFPGIGRASATSFVIGTTAYVGTGLLKNAPYFADDFWSWDMNTNQWTPSSSFPAGFRSRAIGLSVGNVGYVGTGNDSVGTSKSDFWAFSPACNVVAPHICMVTTDSSSNYKYNIVKWDKTLYTNVDSFYVYRKDAISGNYYRIGAVDNDSMGLFIDTLFNIGGPNGGNPLYSSWMYKLSILDTCGFESPKSPYHQTMFVQSNGSNFSWNAYTVESGQSNPVTGYSFMRDDNNSGNWHVLVNTIGLSSTDPNYSNFPNGNWRIDALGFDCANNVKTQSTNNIAHSNTTKLITVGIDNGAKSNQKLIVYPNPAYTNISFLINQKSTIEILDIRWQLLKTFIQESGIISVDLNDLPEGLYFLKVRNESGISVQKFVKL